MGKEENMEVHMTENTSLTLILRKSTNSIMNMGEFSNNGNIGSILDALYHQECLWPLEQC